MLMGFTLPNLPYGYDALEPYIDSRTMEIHHGKHHQAYVDKLNAALTGSEWATKPIEEILQNLEGLPEAVQVAVRNNGGGHYNHSLFWQMMGQDAAPEPQGKLAELIERDFGDLANFKTKFAEAAIGRFGSGWAWLIQKDGKLEITSTPNQDSPIMDGVSPLLGLDVWEHAYYLKYQNRRPDYIENWWQVVNWDFVARQLEIHASKKYA